MPIGNTYQAMPVNKDTIQTISNSNIANDFVSREGVTKPIGITPAKTRQPPSTSARPAARPPSSRNCEPSPSPETIRMTAKTQSARA